MLNSISSFLFGSSVADEPTTDATKETTETERTTSAPAGDPECRLRETSTEEEWILIDKSSREASPDRRWSAPASPFLHPAARVSPHTTTGPPAATATGPPATGESSDSDIGGSSPQRMEQSPLENLLIEHPSMSVYGPRLRQNSAGIDSDISESSEGGEPSGAPSSSSRVPAVSHHHPTGARRSPRRPGAVAARAGLSPTQQTVQAAQVAARRSKKRQISGRQLARDNLLVATRGGKRQRNKSYVLQPAARSASKRC